MSETPIDPKPVADSSFEAFLHTGVWFCLDGANPEVTELVEEPTHWMPLPLPLGVRHG